MKVRFSSFKRIKQVARCEGEHTTRVSFDLPHRMMLKDLTRSEVLSILAQCERLLTNPYEYNAIFLDTISDIEEVANESAFEGNPNDDI